MANKIYSNVAYASRSKSKIWVNSAAVQGWDFVQVSWNFVTVATTSWKIDWVANGTYTFTSDNQTVAMKKMSFTQNSDDLLIESAITWGTITVADEGKFYNLSDARTVDGTTEATTVSTADAAAVGITPVITMQLQLVKFISATKGVFKII